MRNQWNMPTEWEPVVKDSGDKRQAVNLWNLGDGQIRNIVKSVRQGHYYRYPDKTITKYISNSKLHDFDLPWILLPKINSSGVAKDAVYGHYIGHHKIPNNHPFLVYLHSFKVPVKYLPAVYLFFDKFLTSKITSLPTSKTTSNNIFMSLSPNFKTFSVSFNFI